MLQAKYTYQLQYTETRSNYKNCTANKLTTTIKFRKAFTLYFISKYKTKKNTKQRKMIEKASMPRTTLSPHIYFSLKLKEKETKFKVSKSSNSFQRKNIEI